MQAETMDYKSSVIHIRVAPEEKELFRTAAEKQGADISKLLRSFIRWTIANDGKLTEQRA